MFRRPPLLSTRGEDTYDYLTDELDERQQVLTSSLFAEVNKQMALSDSFDLCTNLPIMITVAGGELGRASGVGNRAATSVSPRFSTNSIAKASFQPVYLNISFL